MKRISLVLLFTLCVLFLVASVGITSVNMEDYDGTVVRVVIGFTAESDYRVDAGSGTLVFTLENFSSNSKARINTKASTLVSSIEQDGERLLITVNHPYRYETTTFSYPRRLAIDIFKSAPSKAERLAIAGFYSEKGKLNSADRMYNALHIDYREDTQILYNWAVLLAKRGSSRASEKLAMIPEKSPYFKRAQVLMAKLHGDEEPLPPPPPIEEAEEVEAVAEPLPVPMAAESAKVECVKPEPAKINPFSFRTPGFVKILLILGGLLFVAVLVFVFAIKMKPQQKPEPLPIEEVSVPLESKTLARMVSKLLADGWSMREIAKELRISQREVESLVQLCQSGDYDESD